MGVRSFVRSFILLGLAWACVGESQFSGGSSHGGESRSSGSEQKPSVSSPSEAPAVKAPLAAVSKGSFSAWTVPSDPRPFQEYEIFVLVNLPFEAHDYDVNDLDGTVQGTDGYRAGFGRSTPPPERAYQYAPVIRKEGRALTIVMRIPGGERLVEDRVSVSSKVLGEAHELELVFK